MWNVKLAEEFKRRYARLPLLIQKRAEKQERFFRHNPFYPSLHTEKLEPRGRQTWTFRIDRTYRIAFRFLDKNTVVFQTVGTHDWVYKIWFKNN
jgi:mRNA-degrading endonuclease RelE of RelBE toxin-antitoxin system